MEDMKTRIRSLERIIDLQTTVMKNMDDHVKELLRAVGANVHNLM